MKSSDNSSNTSNGGDGDDGGGDQVSKFAAYGLSPPNKFNNDFERSVTMIEKEFKGTWADGTEEDKKILLFLYSRGYYQRHQKSRTERKSEVRAMLESGAVRRKALQVLNAEKDKELSSPEYEKIYCDICLACHRYFQQKGAVGFQTNDDDNMSNVRYYVRIHQGLGNCFIYAPAIVVSYLVQFFVVVGKRDIRDFSPVDGSKLVRHAFNDGQLKSFLVNDRGGDSCAVLKILDKNLLDCEGNHGFNRIACKSLKMFQTSVKDCMKELGPALVSGFMVNDEFHAAAAAAAAAAAVAIGQHTGVGYIRFTEWGKDGEFIPLDRPTDEALDEQETALMSRCKEFFAVNSKSTEMAVGGSNKSSSDSSGGSNSAGTVVVGSTDSSSAGADTAEEAGEIDAAVPPLVRCRLARHAMVLLGYRVDVKTGETYWALQNSWTSMPLIEVSTEYFIRSDATITFVSERRTPKVEKPESFEQCPSPVAECSLLDRSDGEDWPDSLVYGEDFVGEGTNN
jgi:hypothetical protein